MKWSDPGEDGLRMAAARQAAAKLEPFAVGDRVLPALSAMITGEPQRLRLAPTARSPQR